jgi:hypothetical protein
VQEQKMPRTAVRLIPRHRIKIVANSRPEEGPPDSALDTARTFTYVVAFILALGYWIA